MSVLPHLQPLQFGSFQGMELIIVAVILVIIFFGARKLPEIAKSVGRASGEFEKGRREIEEELERMEKEGKTEGDAIRTAAKDLGIETEGKSDADLKKEIKQKLSTEGE